MAFWDLKKINSKIGTDKAPEIANKVSAIVNPGEGAEGWKKRLDLYRDVTKEIFKVGDCKLK